MLVAVASLTISFYVKYKDAKKDNKDTQEVENNKDNSAAETKYTKEKIDEETNRIRFEGENDYSNFRTYSLSINGLKVDFGKGYGEKIKVYDKEIGWSAWYPQIYTIDSATIIVTGGTDIRSTTVYIVNKNGELIKEIYSLDSNYDDMVISAADDSLTINKEGLKFKGTRGFHGPTLYSLRKTDEYLSDCSTFNKYANEVLRGTYEMKYLGNGTFGEIENTGYTLVKDSDIVCQ